MSRLVLVAIAIGLLMSACASETVVDTSSSELSAIDPADYDGRLLYLNRALDAAPMTAEEMGDTSHAIPVEIGIYGDYMVAWWAPGGASRVGDRGSVVAAWKVFDTSTAEPVADDVRDDIPPDTRPPEDSTRVSVPTGIDRDDTYRLPGPNRPELFIDWLSDYSEEWFIFWGFHPGCV